MEACKMAGFDLEDLIFKTREELEIEWGKIPEAVFEIRYKAYEKRRQRNLKLVMEHRKDLINKQSKVKAKSTKDFEKILKTERDQLELVKKRNQNHIETFLERQVRLEKDKLKREELILKLKEEDEEFN
jgi:hypothetical protein